MGSVMDRRGVLVTVGAVTGVAVLLVAGCLVLLPGSGGDLAAQVARADFAARWGLRPLDFSWYGGDNQFGYSLTTGLLGGVFGVTAVAVVSTVVASAAFTYLLIRYDVRRPLLGGLLGAAALAGNMVSGRITFAVGAAFGLLAFCVLPRRWLAVVLAALATWSSPVAGLFVGLAGAALFLVAESRKDGLALGISSAVAFLPMAVMFGNGGHQPYSSQEFWWDLLLAASVLLFVPRRYRALQIGVLLTVVLIAGSFVTDSPIGGNARRVPLLFAAPIVAAVAELRWRYLAVPLAVACWWQYQFVDTRHGFGEAAQSFYAPLVAELGSRGPIGRVEVVPTTTHWESVWVAPHVPLARGWNRQLDRRRNWLFYAGPMTSAQYHQWLKDQAVSYVAIAPGAAPDYPAISEAALVNGGQPYLREVWRNENWRLYAVEGTQPFVQGAELTASDGGGVTFSMKTPGQTLIKVYWSRWLTAEGATLSRAEGGWTLATVTRPGSYRLTSSVTAAW